MGKITLITSTLGRHEPLTRLLRSLEQQTFKNFEIIIVDQNPTGFLDSTLSPFHSTLDLKHLTSGRGVSQGRNVGLRHATGEIIGFPDDDCWFGRNTLADVVARASEHTEYALLLGRTTDSTGRNSIVPALPADCDIDRVNIIDAANTNAVFVRRQAAEAIGFFDERLGPGASTPFQAAEDRDYVARALALNLKCRFIKGLTVFHDQPDTLGGDQYLARVRKYARGDGAYYRKHRYGVGRIMLMSARAIGGIPLRLLRRQQPDIRFKLTYCHALLHGYISWNEPTSFAKALPKLGKTGL